jgi:hypothetical protein
MFQGLAITLVSDEGDAKILNEVQDRFDVNITELPDEIDLSSYSKFIRMFLIHHIYPPIRQLIITPTFREEHCRSILFFHTKILTFSSLTLLTIFLRHA